MHLSAHQHEILTALHVAGEPLDRKALMDRCDGILIPEDMAGALFQLKSNGLLHRAGNGYYTLTGAGREELGAPPDDEPAPPANGRTSTVAPKRNGIAPPAPNADVVKAEILTALRGGPRPFGEIVSACPSANNSKQVQNYVTRFRKDGRVEYAGGLYRLAGDAGTDSSIRRPPETPATPAVQGSVDESAAAPAESRPPEQQALTVPAGPLQAAMERLAEEERAYREHVLGRDEGLATALDLQSALRFHTGPASAEEVADWLSRVSLVVSLYRDKVLDGDAGLRALREAYRALQDVAATSARVAG